MGLVIADKDPDGIIENGGILKEAQRYRFGLEQYRINAGN